MSYEIRNNSDLSKVLARAIKDELIKEADVSSEVAELVVNHYDLEAHGLADMIRDIMGTVRKITA